MKTAYLLLVIAGSLMLAPHTYAKSPDFCDHLSVNHKWSDCGQKGVKRQDRVERVAPQPDPCGYGRNAAVRSKD